MKHIHSHYLWLPLIYLLKRVVRSLLSWGELIGISSGCNLPSLHSLWFWVGSPLVSRQVPIVSCYLMSIQFLVTLFIYNASSHILSTSYTIELILISCCKSLYHSLHLQINLESESIFIFLLNELYKYNYMLVVVYLEHNYNALI